MQRELFINVLHIESELKGLYGMKPYLACQPCVTANVFNSQRNPVCTEDDNSNKASLENRSSNGNLEA